jgi:hypothetical protein
VGRGQPVAVVGRLHRVGQIGLGSGETVPLRQPLQKASDLHWSPTSDQWRGHVPLFERVCEGGRWLVTPARLAALVAQRPNQRRAVVRGKQRVLGRVLVDDLGQVAT